MLYAAGRPVRNIGPYAAQCIRRGIFRLQFEGLGDVYFKCLRLFRWVTQCDDAFARTPRGPSVDLQLVGIAADPMSVLEGISGRAAPACRFGECVPVGWGQELGSDVHLLQLRTVSEVGVNLVGEVVI